MCIHLCVNVEENVLINAQVAECGPSKPHLHANASSYEVHVLVNRENVLSCFRKQD